MTIVDATGATNRGTTMYMNSRQLNHFSGAHKADNAVMVEMERQLLPNQARRHTVEDAAHTDGAMGTDSTAEDFIIGGSIVR